MSSIIFQCINNTNEEMFLFAVNQFAQAEYIKLNLHPLERALVIRPASNDIEFAETAICITGLPSAQVIGYLWEDGGQVRFSTTGWQSPNAGNIIPGNTNPQGDNTLTIDGPGEFRLDTTA